MPVPLLQKFWCRILQHPNPVAIALLSTMVMIMLSYNTIIRFGLSWPIVMTILKVYPLAVLFIYCLRTYVTLPLVLKLHNYFPKHFTTIVPRHVSIPVLVIAGNVSVMMVILTETRTLFLATLVTGLKHFLLLSLSSFLSFGQPLITYSII